MSGIANFPKINPPKADMPMDTSFSLLLRRIFLHRAHLAGMILAAALLAALLLGQAFSLATFLAALYNHLILWQGLWMFAICFACRAVVQLCADQIASSFSIAFRASLRRDAMETISCEGPRFFLRHSILFLTGVDSLDGLLGAVIPQAIAAGFAVSLIWIAVAVCDPLSGLVLVATIPLLPLFFYLTGGAARSQAQRQFAGLSALGSEFVEALRNFPGILAVNRLDWLAERLSLRSRDYAARTLAVLRVAFLSALALEWAATLSIAVIAVEIGVRALHGGILPFPALAALLLAPEAFGPIRQLALRFHLTTPALAAWREIVPLVSSSSSFAVPSSGLEPNPSRDIQFRNVSFTYPGASTPVLRNATFPIPAGQLTVLTGPSGSGKSTLLALILGFLSPDQGNISLGSVPISMLDINAWRSRIAYVPQAPAFLRGTLRENMLLGGPQRSDAEILAALEKTGAAEFIRRFPRGLDSLLGEGGYGLSSGQAQRLALARAALLDRPVLLLDEPAAFLDPSLQRFLESQLRSLFAGRTILIASHHPRLVEIADQLISLPVGKAAADA